MNARDHIRQAAEYLQFQDTEDGTVTPWQMSGAHALISIACTLADMADLDADTRTQPAVKPDNPTRLELIDKVEQTLRLFTAEDPVRNIAVAVTNTVRGGSLADMDADTRTQPAVKPPTQAAGNIQPMRDPYQLYHPGDTERIPT